MTCRSDSRHRRRTLAEVHTMRQHGTLTKWDDGRGLGFITSAQGHKKIFVHISAFPRDGMRPRLNELISFETQVGEQGKLRAINVMRPGGHQLPRNARRNHRPDERDGLGSILGSVILIVLVVVGVLFGYSLYQYDRTGSLQSQS